MIIKRKTQIILALVVSSVFFFQNCALISRGTSKRRIPERREGDIVITKKDGRQIEGELFAVKPNALLLVDRYGRDASIEIADIRTIRILKRSKARLGSYIGGAVAIGVASLVAISASRRGDEGWVWGSIILGALLAIPGSIIGGLAGSYAGIDDIIQIEGMTDSQIRWALEKLRKKARIRDYK
ncbi:MAG: hypothetical protein GQ476_05790 [Candidatus Aminicenantes bacterium]|nr:hypothetical protein [Candidatus Aminicenantes bacterium]